MESILSLYIRRLFAQPYKTIINLLGFAIGFASIILILFWIVDETGYDKFHEKGDQLYRLNSYRIDDNTNINTNSPFPLAPNLNSDFPEVEMQTRYWKAPGVVRIENKFYREEDVYLVDQDFFQMFNVRFIHGNPLTALSKINSLIITESQSKKYFGESNPVGRELTINNGDIFTVSGVIADPPKNSHMHYEVLGNIKLIPKIRLNSWYFAGPSYVQLKEDADHNTFNEKIVDYYSKFSDLIDFSPYLQNVREIYLNEFGQPGRIRYVWIFSVIVFFIFFMINFNNWSITYVQFLKRKKEIKMRIVNGASKKDLVQQFITESTINILLAFLLSLILIGFAKPLFNNITGKNMDFSFDPLVALIAVITMFVSIVLAAIYPFLFKRNRTLTGLSNSNSQIALSRSRIKPVLIITQVSISIIILIGSFMVLKQLNYIRTKDMGFNKESILYIPLNDVTKLNYETIKTNLESIPEVESVSASSTLPTEIDWWISVNWQGQMDNVPMELAYLIVDYDFFNTMEIDILEGESFSKHRPDDDSISYMISELALKKMGVENPIGNTITMNHNEFPERFRKGKIIGVFKDIHFSSLRSSTAPLLVRMYEPWLFYVLVKYNKQAEKHIFPKVSNVLKGVVPGLEDEVYFLESEFDRQYKQEIVMGKLLKVFAFVIISIFILGLLGLLGYIIETRYKEIGVRKVNGAKTHEILVLLNKDFVKWVAMAFIIACPIAWYFMTIWLENFAFKTKLSWWIFALAGLIAFTIALLTVSIQTWRAAKRNPVETLRYE